MKHGRTRRSAAGEAEGRGGGASGAAQPLPPPPPPSSTTGKHPGLDFQFKWCQHTCIFFLSSAPLPRRELGVATRHLVAVDLGLRQAIKQHGPSEDHTAQLLIALHTLHDAAGLAEEVERGDEAIKGVMSCTGLLHTAHLVGGSGAPLPD